MTKEQLPMPDPEKVKKTVAQMRQVCRQFDQLNFMLDEFIAKIEAEIRKSPLTAYRLGKIPPVTQPEDQTSSESNQTTKF